MYSPLSRSVIFALLLMFVATKKTTAQTPPNINPPSIIPASPTAAAFARYGEVPVDISTGVPKIEIPLYTITSRKLSIPLSLSYHASGIKVNDISTPVGLGWVLNGMGLVSRTVMDRPDEEGNKAHYTSSQSYSNALSALPATWASHEALGEEIYNDIKWRDKQADKFSFTLPTGGGSFRYDFNTSQCIVMPYKPVIINGGSGIGAGVGSFGITDENGTKYSFDKAYATDQSSFCSTCYNARTAYTSWYLTKMVSADGSDEIVYQYEDNITNDYSLGYYSQSIALGSLGPDTHGVYTPGLGQQEEVSQSVNFMTTHEPLLKSIISSTTIVSFGYMADRTDWQNAKYRLATIKIYDRLGNKLIKEIDLDNNHYFGDANINQRLKLNGVIYKGSDGQSDQNYVFNYTGGVLPAYNSYDRIINHRGTPTFNEDYWGYYNGNKGINNSGLIPIEFFAPLKPGGGGGSHITYVGNRRPDAAGMACMLQDIQYPTGGKTSFEFEPNHSIYAYNYSTGDVGGFRVKRITNTDGFDNITTKSYSYNTDNIPHTLDDAMFNSFQEYDHDFNVCYGGVPIGGGIGASRGITQSSSFSSLAFGNGAPVVYTSVTEYNGTEGINTATNTVNTGKTEYLYSSPGLYPSSFSSVPEQWTNLFGGDWFDNGGYQPLLLSKTDYKNENGSYAPVASILNTYQVVRNNEYSTGVNVVKTSYDYDINSGSYLDNGFFFGQGCPNTGLNRYPYHFSYVDNTASEKVSLLSASTQTMYDKDWAHGISVTKNYTYSNPNHLLPTEVTTASSKGEQLRTTYQYPQDNTTDGFAYYLRQANIIGPVIEQKNYRDNTFLNSAKTFYNNAVPGLLIPLQSNVETKQGSNAPESRLQFNNYDSKGNLVDVSKADNIHEAYVYGYNSTLPVAKIISPYGGYGGTALSFLNQAILDNPSDDATLRNHLNTLRSNLSGAQVSTYTYRPLIGMTSETDPAGHTRYYEYDAMGRLAVIRDQNNNVLKKICYDYASNPGGCFVGTYYNKSVTTTFSRNNCNVGGASEAVTYSVPYGKYSSTASQADADQQAQNELNTNGQSLANSKPCRYPNDQLSISLTPNCQQGLIPSISPVTYIVYAGTYQSLVSKADANQLAQTDLSTNAQAYADQNGACVPSSYVFAKISLENPRYVFVSDGGGYNNPYYDIVVRFYQDPNCTIPIQASGVALNVEETEYSDITNMTTTRNYNFSVSGYSSVLFTNIMTFGFEGNAFIERNFVLRPGTGYLIR